MLTLCGRELDLINIYQSLFNKSLLTHVYLTPNEYPRTMYSDQCVSVFENMYQLVIHIQQVHIREINTRLHPPSVQAPRTDATRDIRLDYLLGKHTEDQAKKLLQRREKNRIKCHGYLAVYTMFCQTMEDIIIRIADIAETQGRINDNELKDLFDEAESLRRYVNYQVWKHSKQMSTLAHHLYILSNFTAENMSTAGLSNQQSPTERLMSTDGLPCDQGKFDEPRRRRYRRYW
ncbi:hypothetical protein GGF31_003412 [Allomyces arbusculus]|nr:hypothetical protein GGF31_003412 [Allomyces arbusculus]